MDTEQLIKDQKRFYSENKEYVDKLIDAATKATMIREARHFENLNPELIPFIEARVKRQCFRMIMFMVNPNWADDRWYDIRETIWLAEDDRQFEKQQEIAAQVQQQEKN